ncbi:hypothetical protein, partial [Enterocloster sp.]|uniref:hypothetical protein n=1 Tax=Enterocloster sp. TaxID=2719315 RepID=UPI0039A3D6B1
MGPTGKTIVVPQNDRNTVHIINRNKHPEPAPNRILSRILNCPEPAPEPDHPVRIRKAQPCFYQGTAALIIGVVFVVLAGLIFATTAWHVLPSYCKVIMVLGFSGLFFGSSLLAGKILKIQRTSQAFYILGSIFLFLTVLTAGYFGLI